MKRILALVALCMFGFVFNASAQYDDPPKTIEQSYQKAQDNCDRYAEGSKAVLVGQNHSWGSSNTSGSTRNGARNEYSGNLGGHIEAGVNGAGAEANAGVKRVGSSTDKSSSSTQNYNESYQWECKY